MSIAVEWLEHTDPTHMSWTSLTPGLSHCASLPACKHPITQLERHLRHSWSTWVGRYETRALSLSIVGLSSASGNRLPFLVRSRDASTSKIALRGGGEVEEDGSERTADSNRIVTASMMGEIVDEEQWWTSAVTNLVIIVVMLVDPESTNRSRRISNVSTALEYRFPVDPLKAFAHTSSKPCCISPSSITSIRRCKPSARALRTTPVQASATDIRT